jgi:hypothetical protein
VVRDGTLGARRLRGPSWYEGFKQAESLHGKSTENEGMLQRRLLKDVVRMTHRMTQMINSEIMLQSTPAKLLLLNKAPVAQLDRASAF